MVLYYLFNLVECLAGVVKKLGQGYVYWKFLTLTILGGQNYELMADFLFTGQFEQLGIVV